MRVFAIFCAALLSVIGTLAATRLALDAIAVAAPPTNVDMAIQLTERLRAMQRAPSKQGARRVLYVGDSTAMYFPMNDPVARQRSIPLRLRKQLRSRSPGSISYELFTLIYMGQWVLDDYFLADQMVAAEPDIVLLTFNPASAGKSWTARLSHSEIAGWLGHRRFFEALALPIERLGVTADELLAYNAWVAMGAVDAWRWVRGQQARVGLAWQEAAKRLEERVYSPDSVMRRRAEMIVRLRDESDELGSATGLRARYGAVLDGVDPSHPVLRLLGATVRRLTAQRIKVVVFMLPLNVERFDEVGILDEDGLSRTADSLRQVVEDGGGSFWDLHRLVPTEGFRDEQGHFGYAGRVDGPLLIATELAARMQRMESASMPARD